MKKKSKGNTKLILAILSIVISIALALYLGGWLLFVKPIIECCKAFDNDTLTALKVGFTVIKCLCAGTVASVICWIGFTLGGSLISKS